MELVNEIYRLEADVASGAGPPGAARGARDAGAAAQPVHAARLRGAVAQAGARRRPRARGLAGGRSRRRARGRGRAGGSGERQGARPGHGGARRARRRRSAPWRSPSRTWRSTCRARQIVKCVVVPGRLVSVVVEVRRRELLAAAAGALAAGLRLLAAGTRDHDRPVGQADRGAALQGPHRQARPRHAHHGGGDRGAAEARPLHGREGGDERGRGRRGRDPGYNVVPVELHRRRRPTRAGQPLRDRDRGEGRLPQDRPEGADLGERGFSQRDEYDMGEQPRSYFDREEQSIERLAELFARASSRRCSRRSSGWRGRARPSPRRVQLILGEDSYLAEQALERVLALAVGADRDDAVTVLYGDETRWEAVLAAARTGRSSRAGAPSWCAGRTCSAARRRRTTASRPRRPCRARASRRRRRIRSCTTSTTPARTSPWCCSPRSPTGAATPGSGCRRGRDPLGGAEEGDGPAGSRRRGPAAARAAAEPDAVGILIVEVGQDLRRLIGELDKLEAWGDGRTSAVGGRRARRARARAGPAALPAGRRGGGARPAARASSSSRSCSTAARRGCGSW